MVSIRCAPNTIWAYSCLIDNDIDGQEGDRGQNDQESEEAHEALALFDKDEAGAESLASLITHKCNSFVFFTAFFVIDVQLGDIRVPVEEITHLVQEYEDDVGRVKDAVLDFKDLWIGSFWAAHPVLVQTAHDYAGSVKQM